MGAVAEGSPSIRAQANLSALGLHEMAASLPDYVRSPGAGRSGPQGIGFPYSSVHVRMNMGGVRMKLIFKALVFAESAE